MWEPVRQMSSCLSAGPALWFGSVASFHTVASAEAFVVSLQSGVSFPRGKLDGYAERSRSVGMRWKVFNAPKGFQTCQFEICFFLGAMGNLSVKHLKDWWRGLSVCPHIGSIHN